MKDLACKVPQAAVCLLCAAADWNSLEELTRTEMVGGRVTGPMINCAAVAAILFLVALFAIFVRLRVALAVAAAASVLSLPLYIFRVFPRFFVWISPGEWADPPNAVFVWYGWALVGMLGSTVIIWLNYRTFSTRTERSKRR